MENSADLARQLADYDTKRRSSVDLLNEAMGKYGVPELRNRVSGLRTTLTNTENSLNAVDPSVTGRTQGSLVTEAQRQKQVTDEQAPIAQRYGQLSRNLGDATDTLNDQERAAQLLATTQLNDYETGRAALAGRYQLATDRESEQRRREEADRDYQLSAAKSVSGGYNFGSPTVSTGQASTQAGPDPQTQQAYNAVKSLLDTKNPSLIQKTYDAVRKSAGFGNAYDKMKLALIEQLYPAVKNYGRNAIPLGQSKPTTVPLNPAPSGLGVTVANPGRLAVR